MLKRLSLVALTALAAVVFLASCSTPSVSVDSVRAAGEVHEIEDAPDFTLKDIEGGEVQLADYDGQVVLLNFWATWCGPCKIEMPWFVDFQRKYKDQGFTVLAVSLDEEHDKVRPFAEEQKLNFPVLLGGEEVAENYGGIVALPTTLIIDKQGRIASRHTGLVGRDEYESEIEDLL